MLDVQLPVHLDGKHASTIYVKEDASKTAIETAALKVVGKSYTQAKVTIVPGKMVNVQSV